MMKLFLVRFVAVLMTFLFAWTVQAIAEPSLKLGNAEGMQGETVSLNLNLIDGMNHAGLNVRIVLPQGVVCTDILSGELLSAENFTIRWRGFERESERGVTAVAWSPSHIFNAPSGVLLKLQLRLSSGLVPGNYDIRFADTNSNQLVNSKYAMSNEDGSVSVIMESPVNGMLDVLPAPDTDNDGMPDIWELKLIDADPNDAIATISDVLPSDDFDGDGESNAIEYENFTDPIDPLSTRHGDVTGDKIIALADIILSLKLICHMDTDLSIVPTNVDINGDQKIGMEEIIFILQLISRTTN